MKGVANGIMASAMAYVRNIGGILRLARRLKML
jgi:hypothetical protein